MFITYIYSMINGQFTKNDWLKKKYGDTAYVTNVIKNLSLNNQKIFTLRHAAGASKYTIKQGKFKVKDINYKVAGKNGMFLGNN